MTNVSGSNLMLGDSGRKFPSNGVDYPLRFFNMLHFQRPKSLTELHKWCIILAENSGLIDVVTDKLSRYPITPIRITNDIGAAKDYWSNVLNKQLNIREELVSNGKDYYTFGNCIVSIVPPFKRYLVCSECKTYKNHCINDETSNSDFQWLFTSWKFVAKCKTCKKKTTMTIKDEYLKGKEFINNVKITRWPITNIKVRDLEVCGKKKIYYYIEEKYKTAIINGDKFTISNIPETFIMACKANPNRPILELPSELTYHYKYETITEAESPGMAKPFFFSAWKDVFMSFILRKAQECIASDHLVPNRFIFPAVNGNKDPLSTINGGDWRQIISTIFKRQSNDPNEIGIVPFPVGYQALGGQGKAFSLKDEIEMQDRRILVQLDIPPELIYGGMSWSGGNIALRMLENKFLYYISKQNAFLDFLINYLAKNADQEKPTKVELSPFRMSDDIQQTNMLLSLGAQNKISQTTSMSMIGDGINLEHEAEQCEQELAALKRIAKARAQIDALIANIQQKETGIGAIKNQGEIQEEQGIINSAISAGQELYDGVSIQTTRGIINKVLKLSPADKQQFLYQLQINDPQKWNEVISGLNGIAPSLPATETNIKAPKDINLR